MENVGIVVQDLPAATAFFVELGVKLLGGGASGWTAWWRSGGVRVDVAMFETLDGHGRLELMKFRGPPARVGDRHAPANTLGIRRIAVSVDDIDAAVAKLQARGTELVGGMESYEDSYRLCDVRGPERSSSCWRS
ncbi:MAG: VOC family protein [Mycobacteriales bacterium]